MTAIRPYRSEDAEALWQVLEPIIRGGEHYALPRDMSAQAAIDYWTQADSQVFLYEAEGEILATYYIRANAMGGGAHVANGGYATVAKARNRGIASAMCAHSIEQARRLGFRAMQFNFVFSTNAPALRLWKRHGFAIVGTLPQAYRLPDGTYIAAHIMYRSLLDEGEMRESARERVSESV